MARILIADDGIAFDGKSLEAGPLGGVESSIVNLMQELAKRGHDVHVRNNCAQALDHKDVSWRPIGEAWPDNVDLYIANRGDKVIQRMPDAGRTVFWIHNPADYLMKWRYLSKLWWTKPAIIFIGRVHETTYPAWAPSGERIVIPYGLSEDFCAAAASDAMPAPRAVFTSNPLRSLDWLLDRWAQDIQPNVPGAELHLFTGAATYGSAGDAKANQMAAVLAQADALMNQGVVLRGPVPKSQLIDEFREARCMLYRGDVNETFCLAVGEAQAMGVPAVVQKYGSVVERVIDGETGYVADNDRAFTEAAIKLLSDEELWRHQHRTALDKQRSWRWPDAAAAFENLIG